MSLFAADVKSRIRVLTITTSFLSADVRPKEGRADWDTLWHKVMWRCRLMATRTPSRKPTSSFSSINIKACQPPQTDNHGRRKLAPSGTKKHSGTMRNHEDNTYCSRTANRESSCPHMAQSFTRMKSEKLAHKNEHGELCMDFITTWRVVA